MQKSSGTFKLYKGPECGICGRLAARQLAFSSDVLDVCVDCDEPLTHGLQMDGNDRDVYQQAADTYQQAADNLIGYIVDEEDYASDLRIVPGQPFKWQGFGFYVTARGRLIHVGKDGQDQATGHRLALEPEDSGQ